MKNLKLKSSILVAMLIVFSVGFYACNDDEDKNDNPQLRAQDREFAQKAAQSNMAEIELGQLAVQKAVSDTVAGFAQQMVTDHTNAQTDLDSIANVLDLEMPDAMDSAHRSLRDTLAGLNGFAFDSVYMNSQVLDHQTTKSLLQNYANDGSNNASLEWYANDKLPDINMHLEAATSIRDSLNNQNN